MQDNNKKPDSCDSYFQLVEAVGSNGKYQTAIIILSFIIAFLNAIPSLGTPYYFAVAPYTTCPYPHQGVAKCTEYACSLPFSQRRRYEQPQIKQLRTLGNEFGDFHCEKSDIVESAKGTYYLGSIAGYAIGGMLSDNYGRRPMLLFCLLTAIIGYAVLLLAGDLGTVSVGMLLVGMGCDSCFNVAVMLLSEVLDNLRRQRMVMLFQLSFPLGGMFVVGAFYWFQDWRVVFFWFCLVPFIAIFIFSYFFVQETPQFLVKNYELDEIRLSLRFISRINGVEDKFEEKPILSEGSISKLKEQYFEELKKQNKKAWTYLDLFKYQSLRKNILCLILLFFTCNFLYFGHLMLVDSFGFDFYFNGIMFSLAEVSTYFCNFTLIATLKRRKFALTVFIISSICSFSLIFLHHSQICTSDCWNIKMIMELVAIFVMRFFVAFLFQVLFVYSAELVAVQVVGMALCLGLMVGSIPNTVMPEMINLLKKNNMSVMILFFMVSSLSLFATFILAEETLGKTPVDRIQEIHHSPANNRDYQLVEADD